MLVDLSAKIGPRRSVGVELHRFALLLFVRVTHRRFTRLGREHFRTRRFFALGVRLNQRALA